MDPTLYKDVTTSRGLIYHYYFSPPKNNKPYLLLVHGFPSNSHDWRYQVAFFQNLGYGLVVPDQLGYGGTAKPIEPEAYVSSLITKDLIDILDAEKIDKAIAIGHDWGSKIVSRLHNHHTDRFIAFGFLAVTYNAPGPIVPFEHVLAMTKQLVGYELLGYWKFFSEDDAHELLEANMDSFYSAVVSDDKSILRTVVAPSGNLKEWILAGKTTDTLSTLSSEDVARQKATLLEGGLRGPLNYYKIMTSGLDAKDDQVIPPERIKIDKPVFFGAAKQDYVALAPLGKAAIAKNCTNATIHEFEAGHWLLLEANDEVNAALLKWIEGLNV